MQKSRLRSLSARIRKPAAAMLCAGLMCAASLGAHAQAMCSGDLAAAVGGCKEAAVVASGAEAFASIARSFGRLGRSVDVDVDFDGGRFSGELSGAALTGHEVRPGDLVKLDCSGPTALPRQGRLCQLSYQRRALVDGKLTVQATLSVQVASSGEPDPAILVLAPPKRRSKPAAVGAGGQAPEGK